MTVTALDLYMGLAIAPWGGETAAVRSQRVGAGRHLTNDQLCDLVEAIAARRDRQAFTALFHYFAPRLKGFGMRRGVDPSVAEELVQETLLTVWRRAETFDRQKATVSTWMFTIVRNKQIDMFRRQGYPDADLDEVADQAGDGIAADDQVLAGQNGAALKRAMQVLPREQLELIEKAFFEDKSHSVIAEEMGLPLGTVKSRIRLALARLRGALPETVHD